MSATNQNLGLAALSKAFMHRKVVETSSCTHPGCSRTTRENKPFCKDHVEKMPYVQGIFDKLRAQQEEIQQVKLYGAKAVDPEGLQAKELLGRLGFGGHTSPQTIDGLAKSLGISSRIVMKYAIALRDLGKVKFTSNGRDSLMLSLV